MRGGGTPLAFCEKIFSVVVPFLNEERWLPACLEALNAQTLDRSLFELIFVDNGSTDRSAEIVAKHSGVLLLHEPQRDPYLARNRGIAAASARHIVFLDADCLPEPDWLRELQAEVAQSPLAIVLGYVAHPVHASIFSRCFEEYYDAKLVHIIRNHLTCYYFGHAGNMVVRADLFRELGLFHAMPIAGDTEIIHRSLTHNQETEIRYARRARVVHAEMQTLRNCIAKYYDTGGHAPGRSQQGRFSTLRFPERWRALCLWLTIRRPRGHRIVAMLFVCLVGLFGFETGRIAYRLWLHKNSQERA
jgi:glycosyltransferase involved in cell wall biosynthesis